MKNLISIISLILILSVAVIIPAKAQDQTNSAITISVNDTNVQVGDVICSGSNGYKLCTSEYDSSMFGVVTNSAPTSLVVTGIQNPQFVVTGGETSVRVSSATGNIKAGDSLTSSTIPGVVEKATQNGYVLGTALSDYSSNDKSATGLIKISMSIHPRTDVLNVREDLIGLLRNGLSGVGVSPIAALRYVSASAIVIVSFAIGFLYFGRIAKTGIEAIGRNPLAVGRIQASVFLNIIIMIVIAAIGFATAYIILII